MERITQITPAFDKRSTDMSKNYGIHGCDLRMVLKGNKGAVQFVLFTQWHLPTVTVENRKYMHPDKYFLFEPMPADVGYHSKVPMYEGQSIMSDSCEYCDGEPCYYDGSGLEAEKVYEILLNEGGEGVWTYLEEYYNELFGGDKLRSCQWYNGTCQKH